MKTTTIEQVARFLTAAIAYAVREFEQATDASAVSQLAIWCARMAAQREGDKAAAAFFAKVEAEMEIQPAAEPRSYALADLLVRFEKAQMSRARAAVRRHDRAAAYRDCGMAQVRVNGRTSWE